MPTLLATLSLTAAAGLLAAPASAPTTPPRPIGRAHLIADPTLLQERTGLAIRAFLGDPANTTVRVLPAEGAAAAREGRLAEIDVDARDSVLRGLSVRRLHLKLRDCRVDLDLLAAQGKLKFVQPGTADLMGVVGERELNETARRNAGRLRVDDPCFDFKPGGMRFTGRLRLPLLQSQVDVEGPLEIVGGAKVHYRPTSFRMNSFQLPGFVRRTIAERVNPILDLGRLGFAVTLCALATTDDALYTASAVLREELDQELAAAASAPGGSGPRYPPGCR